MKRLCIIAGMTFFLVLTVSVAAWGADFSLAGNLYSIAFDQIFDVQYENYAIYPFVPYFDCYFISKENSFHLTGICGFAYCFAPTYDSPGVYAGLGLTLLTGGSVTGPEACNATILAKFDRGADLRLGYRESFSERTYVDLGYSTLKGVYINLGFNF